MRSTTVLMLAVVCLYYTNTPVDAAPRVDAESAVHDCSPTRSVDLTFWQLSIEDDEGLAPYSSWGAVDVDLSSSSGLLYFNLVVGEDWQIQNLPLLVDAAIAAGGGSSTTYFDLGVAPGTQVTEVTYAADLTTAALGAAPSGSAGASVGQRDIVLRSGELGFNIAVGPPPLSAIVGGTSVAVWAHGPWPEFPNQDCQGNECAPVAVSNNMLWLNELWNIGMDPALLTTEELYPATGCVGGGSPAAPPFAPPFWWTIKRLFMETHYPVVSTLTRNLADVAAAIPSQGIELRVPGHVVSVIAMGQLDDGRFWFSVAHDANQGTVGGTVVETPILDPETTLLIGTPWFTGIPPDFFLMQRYDFYLGACCTDTACIMNYEDECEQLGGTWHESTWCAADPCGPVSVERKTWGAIKALYK